MFYLGLLVLPCTHTEGPRSPRPVGLFTLNHRVFRPLVGDRRPSSQTVVPRPSAYLLLITGYFVPLLETVVPRPGPSSLVLWHIYSKSPLDVLDSYPTLRLSSICLSIYHNIIQNIVEKRYSSYKTLATISSHCLTQIPR